MPRFAIINGATVENVILADSAPTIPGRTVVAVAGQVVSPGDTYGGGVFTPYTPSAAELERRDAPAQLRQVLPQLRQWGGDALSAAELTALTAAQRIARQATQEQRVAALSRLMMRVIWMVGQDDGS